MTGEIRAAIESDGPIPFERFMDLALYGEEGFYTGPVAGSAGRRGDFITSPEVGPLFGAVLARWIDAEWDRLGQPDNFTVVDLGAGPGTLARSVRAARPQCVDALRYVAVEVSDRQRARHPDGIESRSDMSTKPFVGVIIMNELLDNLAFRLAVFDDGWREAFVDVDVTGRFEETLSDRFDPVPDVLPATAPLGARAPLADRAGRLIDQARGLLQRGSLLSIDYAVPRTAELALRPWREWLRTYRGNERGGHYLTNVGAQDITIDVPLDQLPEPEVVRSQSQFLQLCGITDLVDEGRRVWTQQAARPGLEALTMRSRISESEALLDPSGLGSFVAVTW